MTEHETNLLRELKQGTMGFRRTLVVAICMFIVMIDGFDVLVISFVASDLSRGWGIGASELGALFSAALLGMGVGSFVIAPLADRFGRRPIIILGLIVVTLGMFTAAAAGSIQHMLAARLVTGLGVGCLLPSLNTLVAEVTSEQRKALAVPLAAAGYPIGAMLGGLASIGLIANFGWRSVFVAGGMLSTTALFLVLAFVPESISFLLRRRPEGALQRINRAAKLLSLPFLATLPAAEQAPDHSPSKDKRTSYVRATIMMALAFFASQVTFYFVMNWVPKILSDSGMNRGDAISVSVLMNLGGVIGGISFGFFARRQRLPTIVAGFMIAAFLLVAIFPQLHSLRALQVLCFLIGLTFFSLAVGLYAVIADVFPVEFRMTGTGIAVGAARAGAAIGPAAAGVMIGSGFPQEAYFPLLAVPMLFAAAVLLPFQPQFTRYGAPTRTR
jgi:benzoate transport